MLSLIWKDVKQRGARTLLLILAVLVVSAAFGLLLSAAETTEATIDQELAAYWRTTYDILVRPPGSRSAIEDDYGLVEANHLSGIDGGITFEQYELIKSIPGIEVAAPVAMIGYLAEFVRTAPMPLPPRPGAYWVTQSITVFDGLSEEIYSGPALGDTYIYVLAPDEEDSSPANPGYEWPLLVDPEVFQPHGAFVFTVLMAGIDPHQEAALVGLDEAVLQGQYLTGQEALNLRGYDRRHFASDPQQMIDAPILINRTDYVDARLSSALFRVGTPPEASTLAGIMQRGGREYFADLPPVELLDQVRLDGADAYDALVRELMGDEQLAGAFPTQKSLFNRPSRIRYRETSPPFEFDGLALQIVPPEEQILGVTVYRTFTGPDTLQLEAAFTREVKGVFDLEHIALPEELSRVPLETYVPPVGILRFDEEGRPLEPPVNLLPTLNPAGYIQPPPLMLTTLEAARAIRGEAAISAIRVRVADIDRFTPEAQAKIEAVAGAIVEATGLDVDVVVGSSPRRVLVRVPEIGYVEEQWIQKGVSLSIGRSVERVNFIFFGVILVVSTLSILNTGLMTAVGRKRQVALQKALGWRSSTVLAASLLEMGGLGSLAGALGAVLAAALAPALGLEMPPARAALLIPLGATLTMLGGLLPAVSSARLPPALALAQGETRPGRSRRSGGLGLAGYARQGLLRRRIRTYLTALTIALGTALLAAFLTGTMALRGYLSGSLLGDYVILRVEPLHYVMAAVTLLVAGITTAESLLVSALERRREIGVLKAIGWRGSQVLRLFLLEGLTLGLIGGLVGVATGGLLMFGLYGGGSATWIPFLVGSLAVPLLVGLAAAAVPGCLAARTPPAQAVRYE